VTRRCACRECREGDALPERLQGWPGAYQMTFIETPASYRRTAMAMPTFDDTRLKSACQDRCADVGDPPCYEVVPGCKPCGECLRDIGIEPGDEFDEDAAIGRLI
jgi:hypothetical protein